VAAVTACSESRTFTPVSPSDISARAIQALNEEPFLQTQTIGAGRTIRLSGAAFFYGDEEPSSVVYVFDWISAANHVTFALHRVGDPPPRESGSFTTSNDCAIPQPTESIIGAPLSRPLCPIALSNTSSDKPKLLEVSTTLPPGDYRLVVSNHGSTGETIRWTFLRN
jgi:hypothetical protein